MFVACLLACCMYQAYLHCHQHQVCPVDSWAWTLWITQRWPLHCMYVSMSMFVIMFVRMYNAYMYYHQHRVFPVIKDGLCIVCMCLCLCLSLCLFACIKRTCIAIWIGFVQWSKITPALYYVSMFVIMFVRMYKAYLYCHQHQVFPVIKDSPCIVCTCLCVCLSLCLFACITHTCIAIWIGFVKWSKDDPCIVCMCLCLCLSLCLFACIKHTYLYCHQHQVCPVDSWAWTLWTNQR